MQTVKEYARSRGISTEAVNKQLRKNPEELEGHVFPVGKTFELDEEAIQYLDEHRLQRTVLIEPVNEEVKKMMQQKDAAIQELQEKLRIAQNQIIEAQAREIAWNKEKLSLIEDRGRYQGLLESKDREQSELKERIQAAEDKVTEQSVLIREKESKISDLELAADSQQKELNKFHKTFFGLYKKEKD